MLKNVAILAMAKRRMDWGASRQEIIAENIANANTPGYRSRDIKALTFQEMVTDVPVTRLVTTHPLHMSARSLFENDFGIQEDRQPFETKLDGNTVSLEEQTLKMTDTKGLYDEAATLFQKYVGMYRTSLSKGS